MDTLFFIRLCNLEMDNSDITLVVDMITGYLASANHWIIT